MFLYLMNATKQMQPSVCKRVIATKSMRTIECKQLNATK
jgi:hypothetical protein